MTAPSPRQARPGLVARVRASEWTVWALSLVLALGTGTILGLSRWLQPDIGGHGTHLQLGLGQCTILSATGYPCPMCGVTTTFAHMADLHPVMAVVTQPFGVLVFLMTVAVFAISTAEVVLPRRRWQRLARLTAPYDSWLAGAFLAAMAAGWLYKVHLMRGLW